jgi:2-polyprenyl-6-methoxyphenol hydroxylase-like FAD-dependent oxidoreductase
MRVLISGSGIAGPVLAYWLSRLGHNCTVLDKASSMRATGQNIDISGSAITVAKKMRVLDEIRKWNTTEKGTQLVDPKGEFFAKFPLRDGGFSGTNPYEILRGDLAQIFYEKAKQEKNIEWRFGTTVTTVLENSEKGVKVELSSGEVDSFDLLVAADGQWSSIRKQLFPAESIKLRDLGMFCVHWTVPRQEDDNDWWNIYPGLDRRMVTTRPDPHGTTRVMLTHMPSTKQKKQEWDAATRSGRKEQMELIRRDFANVGWQMPRFMAAMDDADDFYYWPMQQIQMDNWSVGRVVCLGDAAYAPTPLTGSGTPLAIIGAYCLAGELSKFSPEPSNEQSEPKELSCEDIRSALAAYESLYHPWVSKIQNTIPPFLPGAFHTRTSFQRWLLSIFFRTVSMIFNW